MLQQIQEIGETIFTEDFRDEFHSRLKFNHSWIVDMKNKNKPNTNGREFFIILDKCEEMNKKLLYLVKLLDPLF